ncbi:hypothetical protein LTR17_015928 [Elasticomyces elasticus]|nr:hypothetical protein LTR17_015928 [Elasticomyces elasticus]
MSYGPLRSRTFPSSRGSCGVVSPDYHVAGSPTPYREHGSDPLPGAASESSSITLFYPGYSRHETRRWPDEENLSSDDDIAVPLALGNGYTDRTVILDESQLISGTGQDLNDGADPSLVEWTSRDDPLNPHNWPAHRRWISTILIATFAFIAPMASTMVAPALHTSRDEMKVETDIEEFLIMSIFLLAFALGPFLWGPCSEVYGRVSVVKGAKLIFLVFNTACGFAQTKQQMMAFRFLSGIGGSAPQAIGGGINHDCFRKEDRGLAVAVYSLMPFLSSAVAPIMGGYLTQYLDWRWMFFVTSIFDAVVQIACFFLLRETHHPTILRNKARALRRFTGNPALHTAHEGPNHSMKKTLMKSLVRPFIMLGTQPSLIAMSLFRGFQYGIMYLVFATFGLVFEDKYGQDVGRASLNYLSLGIGSFIGLAISGTLQDKVYRWCMKHTIDPRSTGSTWVALRPAWFALSGRPLHGELLGYGRPYDEVTNERFCVPRKPLPVMLARPDMLGRIPTNAESGIPEYRLPLVVPFSFLIPVGLFIYGWSAQHTVHWVVPNLGTAIMCIGLIVCFNCVQAYTVDTYTTYSASATGAAACIWTMCGFSSPLFGPRM